MGAELKKSLISMRMYLTGGYRIMYVAFGLIEIAQTLDISAIIFSMKQ